MTLDEAIDQSNGYCLLVARGCISCALVRVGRPNRSIQCPGCGDNMATALEIGLSRRSHDGALLHRLVERD